jgi:Zn-dependent protease with chaperone function
MTTFEGTWFDGKSARAHAVTVTVEAGRMIVRGEGIPPVPEAALDACRISPPLGSIRRTIVLPDGSRIETRNLEAVDEIERRIGANRGLRRVHFLERNGRTVLLCLAALALFVRSLIVWGIPALAGRIAESIPSEAIETVSRNTMMILEKRFFEPSELQAERRIAFDALFREVSDDLAPSIPCRLEHRRSPKIGPNAFALPSGTILVMDELAELFEDDGEAIGVYVHEITHVERRHGLRSVFQNTGVFLLISALVGDITSITAAAGALPTLLAETGYSRRFEREADEAVARYFHDDGGSVEPYLDLIRRMSAGGSDFPGKSYVSTHPVAEGRIRHLEEYARSLEGE